LWRKCATHPNHHTWWATNVAPVLDAVAEWQRFDVASVGVRAGRGAPSVAPTTTPPPVEDAPRAQGNPADG
jgi:hypothetical protein